MAFQLSSQKAKNVRVVVTMGIIHGIRKMIGFVLTEKGGKVGMIALILSIIAFVIAVVNLIFVTRR